MRRIIAYIAMILLVAGATAFIASKSGETQIGWGTLRITAPTGLVLAAVVVLVWFVLLFDRVLSFIASIPHRFSGSMTSRNGRLGRRALALGMAAAAAGDGREATHYARRAVHYLGHDALTDLLLAQAAALRGDGRSAARYFDALKSDPDTAYFGHVGMMRLAHEKGDSEAALVAGRQALVLKPKSAAIAGALFTSEALAQNWGKARKALAVAQRGDKGDTHVASVWLGAEAALLWEEAREESRPRARIRLLEAALRVRPDFIPAALDLAQCYLAGKRRRKATSLLERVFIAAPHPEVATLLYNSWSGQGSAKLSRLIRLAEKIGGEALLAAAMAAYDLEMWGEAQRLVLQIPEDARDSRVWRLLADIAAHHIIKTDDDKILNADQCLRRAAVVARPPCWACEACGARYESYQSICDTCGCFAQVAWRR